VRRWSSPRSSGVASAEESEQAARSGAQGFAADFLGWRRSALLVAAAVVLSGAVATSTDLLLRWSHHARHLTDLGVAIELIGLRLLLPWLVGALCLAAAATWSRLRLSLPLVVAAAILEIVPAFLLSMLPPHWMIRPPAAEIDVFTSRAVQIGIAAGLALRLVGLLSAAFRASVVAKLLMPESPVPGATIAALLPINLGFAVAGYVAINAVVHGWLLLAAWLCIVLYQLLFLARGTALLHPQDEASARLAFLPAMRGRLVLIPATAIFLALFLLTSHNSLERPLVTAHWLRGHWVFLVGILTNYVLTLVVGVDLIVHGVSRLSARRSETSSPRRELERRLEEKSTAIVQAGEPRR
jgi:hypothetical protein